MHELNRNWISTQLTTPLVAAGSQSWPCCHVATCHIRVCVDEMKDTTIYEYPNSVYSQNVYLPNKVKAKQDAGDVPGTQRKRGDWAVRDGEVDISCCQRQRDNERAWRATFNSWSKTVHDSNGLGQDTTRWDRSSSSRTITRTSIGRTRSHQILNGIPS